MVPRNSSLKEQRPEKKSETVKQRTEPTKGKPKGSAYSRLEIKCNCDVTDSVMPRIKRRFVYTSGRQSVFAVGFMMLQLTTKYASSRLTADFRTGSAIWNCGLQVQAEDTSKPYLAYTVSKWLCHACFRCRRAQTGHRRMKCTSVDMILARWGGTA